MKYLLAVTKQRLVCNPGDMMISQQVCAGRHVLLADSLQSPLPATLKERSNSLWELSLQRTLLSGQPIYYHFSANGDFFAASHIRLLQDVGVRLEADESVLPEFLVYRCVMPPRTLYREIFDVPPLNTLSVDITPGGCRNNGFVYRELPMPEQNLPLDKAVSSVFDLLDVSLQRALGHSPALLLSGGIDSSTVLAMAKRHIAVEKTWSTGYPFESNTSNWEREYALSAANYFRTQHTYFSTTTQRYIEAVVESIAAAETPVHHLQSPLLHLLLTEGLPDDRQSVIIALGAGGCFGNFRNFLYPMKKPWFRTMRWPPFPSLVRLILLLTGRGRYLLQKLQDAGGPHNLDSPENPMWRWHAHGSPDWVMEHFGARWEDIIESSLRVMQPYSSRSIYDRWALYSLIGDEAVTQAIWSQICRAAGRLPCCPYYDDDLIDFVLGLSWQTKLASPENALRLGIAKKCEVPDFIGRRPKSGFGIRRDDWAVQDGPLSPLASLAINEFGAEEVRSVQSTDLGLANVFWGLVNYSIWKRIMIKGDSPSDVSADLGER